MSSARVLSAIRLVALCSSGLCTAALADTDGTSHASGIELVVVTAEKRQQTLQDVSASISALDASALKQRGINSIESLQYQVPNLQFGSSFGISDISIRGIGLNEFSGLTDAPVAIHVDGLYLPRPSMGDVTENDLARIEVLRGPQGTLYGRNSTAGVINFITDTPTDEFDATLRASYESFDETHVLAIVDIPIADGILSRVALNYMNRGIGFIKDTTPGLPSEEKGSTYSARGTFEFALGSKGNLELSLFTGEDNVSSAISPHGIIPAGAIAINPWLAGADCCTDPWTTASGVPTFSDRHYSSIRGTLTWDLGFANFKSITGYQDMRWHLIQSEGTSVVGAIFDRRDKAETYSQEFNLSGTWDPVDWLIGAYYMHDRYNLTSIFTFPHGINDPSGVNLLPGSIDITNSSPSAVDALAAFADATIHITDKLRAIAGARLSSDRKSFNQTIESGPVFIPFPIPGVPGTPGVVPLLPECVNQVTDVKYESFTPRGGLRYDFDTSEQAYLTVSRGFKGGGVNPDLCTATFKPETITAYEAGYKATMEDGHLTLAASAFYYDYNNLQVNQILFTQSIIVNAPATVKGVELESMWQLDDNWRVDGSASWLEGRYGHFFSQDPLFIELDPAEPPVDLTGHRLNNAPTWSGNLGVQYQSDMIPDIGTFVGRAEAHVTDKYYFRPYNLPGDAQPSYGIVNLYLYWQSESQRFEGRLFAKNVGNVPVIQTMDVDSPEATRYVTWNKPRQIGAELSVHF